MTLSGDEWIARAIERAENAVHTLRFAQLSSGPTRSALAHAYDQLFTASEHLRDAGFELGIGDVK